MHILCKDDSNFTVGPLPLHAAQVVIGKNNQAIQATSQDATNSISNVNSAGRRLLDGEQQHAEEPHSCWLLRGGIFKCRLHQSKAWQIAAVNMIKTSTA